MLHPRLHTLALSGQHLDTKPQMSLLTGLQFVLASVDFVETFNVLDFDFNFDFNFDLDWELLPERVLPAFVAFTALRKLFVPVDYIELKYSDEGPFFK